MKPELNETPDVSTPSTPNSDDGLMSAVPLSKRQLALIVAVVVVAVVVWRLRQTESKSGGAEVELAKIDESLGAGEVAVNGEDEKIHIPNDPDDPLAADAAAYEALKKSGKVGGVAS